MRAKEVIGQKVITLDGANVGEVVDLEIGDDWRVEHLVVKLERDIAKEMGFKFTLRPKGLVPVSLVKGYRDYITLEVEGKELRDHVKKAD